MVNSHSNQLNTWNLMIVYNELISLFVKMWIYITSDFLFFFMTSKILNNSIDISIDIFFCIVYFILRKFFFFYNFMFYYYISIELLSILDVIKKNKKSSLKLWKGKIGLRRIFIFCTFFDQLYGMNIYLKN